MVSRKSEEAISDNVIDNIKNVHKDGNDIDSKMEHLKIGMQMILAIFLILSSASTGLTVGYSAVLLPQLNATNGTLHIDEEMGSWIASINVASTPLGALLSGLLMDYFGRKNTLVVQIGVTLTSWTIIAGSGNHYTLLIGRFFGGIATGFTVLVGQVYAAEMSNPKMSGIFNSIPFSSAAFGILLIYALGALLNWKVLAVISILITATSAIPLYFLPESPAWHVKKYGSNAERNFNSMFKRTFHEQKPEETESLLPKIKPPDAEANYERKCNILCTPPVIKPFVIILIFKCLQTLSGVHIFIFYAVDIISQIVPSTMSTSFIAVMTAAVRLLFTIVANVLLGFIGRRTMGLFSSIASSIACAALGTFLYINDSSNSFISALCLLFYIAASTVGLTILPGMMVGELFPLKARGIAGGLSYTIFSVFSFGLSKLFPIFKNILHIYGLFWSFGIASFLAAVLIYLTLPETKDRTLEEIEVYFSQSNILWITRGRIISEKNGEKY